MSIINELEPVLKRIEQRLSSIESQIGSRRPLYDVVSREQYSCSETADLSQTHGVRAYKTYTVRLACNEGRITEAWKLEDGSWRIPRSAVLRVLEDGIPPQRRNGKT
jgi:hypothetical protein